MNSEVIREVFNYLIEHVNENITMDDLENVFHYNKFYLIRSFRECTGYTPIEFINELRVYNSTDPLIYTDDSILKIALNNGFNSQEYYSEKFKGVIGTSPLKFRKIYSGFVYIINHTDNIEELEEVKGYLNEISVYQESIKSYDRVNERPNVKVFINKKAA